MTQEKNETAQAFWEMMKSCYTYGGTEKSTYNYHRYILPYKTKLGAGLFKYLYSNYSKELSQYKIKTNVYTDSEGLTYNTLTK